VLGPIRRLGKRLNRVQKRAAKYANNINVSVWDSCTAKIDNPNMRTFQGIHLETGLENDREYTSKTMLSE
jgi:hypothetical protein